MAATGGLTAGALACVPGLTASTRLAATWVAATLAACSGALRLRPQPSGVARKALQGPLACGRCPWMALSLPPWVPKYSVPASEAATAVSIFRFGLIFHSSAPSGPMACSVPARSPRISEPSLSSSAAAAAGLPRLLVQAGVPSGPKAYRLPS